LLHTDLLDAQRAMELKSLDDGYDRFLKEQETTKAHLGASASYEATRVIDGSIPLVTKEIESWLETNDRKGRGRTHVAVAVFKRFDPEALALIALNTVFTGVLSSYTVTKIQRGIGQILQAETYAMDMEEERAERIKLRLKAQGSMRNKQKVLAKLMKETQPEDVEDWSEDLKVKAGEPLVNAVLLSLPDIFELHTLINGHANVTSIRLTNEAVDLLSSLREAVAWNQPIHKPMVVPPRPWESFYTGCYYEEKAARNVRLVRTYNRDHQRLVTQAIKDGTMGHVLDAVNAIQSTSWAINEEVLKVVKWAWDNNIDIPGLPRRDLTDLPSRLDAEVWENMTESQRKGHRLTILGLREKNRAIVADRQVIERDLATANELTKYERFYLPHNLDFRGRVYPVCHFSHQRSDHIKALFQFADGCPLGDYGAGWLSVHLANCGDFGKVSKGTFYERIDWVRDNEDLILRVAGDPTGTVSEWAEADSPFMFLAACLDYAGWVRGGRSDLYVSRLPIALDGSNSGLQHYSAALRAEDEAGLVSLVPSERPADLYQTVANAVKAEVEKEAEEGDRLAQIVLKVGVTRGLVKRNVMTFAYSSEQYGFRQQLMSDTMRPLNDAVLTGKLDRNPFEVPRKDAEGNETDQMDGGFAAAGYLAQKVYRGVTAVVHKATEGMTFFKQVASVLAHEGLPLVWTSPVGLPVMHRYNEWDMKRLQLFLFDRNIKVTPDTNPEAGRDSEQRGAIRSVRASIRTKPTGRIDKAKARSAVAPNVIHSMDGAHLKLTVLEAKELGITDIALIHDSFGTHAGRTQEFFYVIREAFVSMYANYDPFEEVLEAAKAVLSDEGIKRLPKLPAKGTLDLNVILDAPYAFA